MKFRHHGSDTVAATGSPYRTGYLFQAAVVLASVTLGTALHLVLMGWLQDRTTLLPMLFAVLVAAFAAGGWAGAATTVLCAVMAATVSLAPMGSPLVAGPADQFRLVLFVLMAVFISMACEAMHRARRRSEAETLAARAARAETEDLHQRFQLALEAGQMVVWDWDIEADRIVRSDNAKAMYGLTGETIDRFYDLVHPDDREALEQAMRLAVETQTGYEQQFRVHFVDGTIHWLATRAAVRTHSITGRRHVTGSAVDITDRVRIEERLRESSDRFGTMADSISQLVWTASPDGSVDWVNQRWVDYTGISLAQFQKNGWQLVVEPAILPKVTEAWATAIASGTVMELTFPLRGSDGAFCPFLMKAVPIVDSGNRVTQWFGTHTDLTNQLALETQRREEDRRQDAFLATLAHELRNPLAPLRNGLEVLKRLPPEHADRQRTQMMMGRQLAHMSRLLDDLLVVSRLKHGKLELNRKCVDLSQVLELAIEVVDASLANAGQTLTVERDADTIEVDGDSFRLSQAFVNLIDNASKFSARDQKIVVSIRKVGFQAEILIQDQGIGISRDQLPLLFDLFWQGPATTMNAKRGLGIGLPLVRNIVELHGGTVTISSEGPGKGSVVTVRLPLALQLSLEDAGHSPAARATGASVLVVDDNRDSADSLAFLVRLEGHEVVTAYDGASALALAESRRPTAVILDIGMPGMDGYETCRRLRQMSHGSEMMIIALTGWGQPDDRRRTKEAGFNAHFVKPIQHDELASTLRAAMTFRSGPGESAAVTRDVSTPSVVLSQPVPIESMTLDLKNMDRSRLNDAPSFSDSSE